jgi:phospholipid/cholesterol/gamma-HCH transport system permease protein
LAVAGPVHLLGAAALTLVAEVGRIGVLAGRSAYWLTRRPFRLRLVVKQFEFVGVQSTFIIVLTGLFTGAVFALQTSYAFRSLGANAMVGPTVVLALTRELAPVLTGLMVTGRVGSAMTAELGSMRVTEQIDALETLAVSPVQYLVVPRLLAAIGMMPLLSSVFSFVGAIGAYVVSVHLLGISGVAFREDTIYYVDFDDYYIGLIKAAFFGLVIGLIACHKGFTVTGGAEGVGRATTQAVVYASVTILISDYFLTALLF